MHLPTRLIFAACALSAGSAQGNGFYVPVQAPEATARGNAWLATADSAAAVYYNAAGLTQLEAPEVVFGGYAIMLGLRAELDSGKYEKANNDWAFLPQIYAAVPVSDRLVAGIGLNTPFGLATHWDQNSQFSPLAVDTQLTYATAWAVLGYKVTDTFSIGGGLGIHHADLHQRQAVPFKPLFSQFDGDSEALSWTVSAQWKPTEQHAFGIVYRSKADFLLKGDVEVIGLAKETAKLDFITPATLGVGYAYTPCKKWSFEANVEWVNWNDLNTLHLTSQSGALNNSEIFNWESNFIYSIGGTRYFENGWNVSAGYNYIENSQPDANFNPGVSDANRHWLNAGFGYKHNDLTFQFAYQYAFSDRKVSGSPFGLADGTYKSRFHGLMANIDWQF
jgi:long-chain fatty acid transport protein